MGDFNGVYYQGKAKYYKLTGVNEPVREFWYFTDLDGKPVQQGEAGTGPTDQGDPTSIGHTIWHDYDQSTFDTSAIDPSVFAIPELARRQPQNAISLDSVFQSASALRAQFVWPLAFGVASGGTLTFRP